MMDNHGQFEIGEQCQFRFHYHGVTEAENSRIERSKQVPATFHHRLVRDYKPQLYIALGVSTCRFVICSCLSMILGYSLMEYIFRCPLKEDRFLTYSPQIWCSPMLSVIPTFFGVCSNPQLRSILSLIYFLRAMYSLSYFFRVMYSIEKKQLSNDEYYGTFFYRICKLSYLYNILT